MAFRITASLPSRVAPPSAFGAARPLRLATGWPVVLYDRVVVPSSGGQTFKSEAFTNNLGRPIELHGLRVIVQLATGASGRVVGGGVVALEIEIDGFPVTRSAVPIWNLCRSDNRRSEDPTTSGTTSWAWQFAHPVPLGSGRPVKVHARHLGVVSQDATVYLAFVGATSDGPIARRIPYAAYWESRSFTYAEAATDSAPPAALVNDRKRDVFVSRIIGRSIAYDDASGAGASYHDYSDLSTQGVSSLSLRLGLSQARPILKTYTQWRAVFGAGASVETGFLLAPGDFLTADVQHAAGPVLATPFTYSQNKGGISIVGWREE